MPRMWQSVLRKERRSANSLQPWLVLLGTCQNDDLPYTSMDVFCGKYRWIIQKGEQASGPLMESIPVDADVIAAHKVDTCTEMEQANMNMEIDQMDVSMDIDATEKNIEVDEVPIMECPPMECDIADDAEKTMSVERPRKRLDPGRRILSSVSLCDFVQKICDHGRSCQNFEFQLSREKRNGLRSEIYFLCKCESLEVKLDSDSTEESLPINDAMAWGCAQAPLGYDAANNFLTTLDLKGPSRKAFKKFQERSYELISKAAQQSMADAGKLERELSEDTEEFADVGGVNYPCTTVKVDGCWGKRSYGHGFNSHCGTAVGIGAKSKNVLFNDTRVRTCVVCDTAKNKGEEPVAHNCFKNWNQPSTAMEANIIAQGFKDSIKMHGLVFTKFVGDGDSSTHAAVINAYEGLEVQKVECSNHVMKNLTGKLIEISQNRSKNIPASIRRLPKMAEKFGRITGAIVGAINYHSANIGNETWKLLRADILNVPRHVFGDHTFCREYFCPKDGPRRSEKSVYPIISSSAIYPEIMAAIHRVASLASSLLERMNTNQAECFMSVVNKYVEGKRKHFGHRFLYNLRILCAVLAYNTTTFWAADAYQMAFNRPPSQLWLSMKYQSIKNRNILRKKRNQRRPKYAFLKSKTGDQNYGSHPDMPDLEERDPNEFQLQLQELHASLQVNDRQRNEIEENTRDQSASDLWFEMRGPRLTGSNSHLVSQLRPTTDNTSILNIVLGRARFSSEDTSYGKANEKNAIAAYEKVCGFPPGYVRPAGLMVSREDGILASTPDGFVGSNGLLEIKCPSKWRNNDPKEWPRLLPPKKRRGKGDPPCLKTSDPFYSQVVMQLFTAEKEWVDFFVWTPHGHFLQRIHRDPGTTKIWEKMKSKLIDFWKKEVAPELVDSRYLRGKPYRCPEERKAGREKLNLKRLTKNSELGIEGASSTADLSDAYGV